MKKNILRISILPLIILFTLSFIGLQPQKDNIGKKENRSESKGNKNDRGKEYKGNSGMSQEGNHKDGDDRGHNDYKKGDKGQSEHSNAMYGDRGNQKNMGNNHKNDKGKVKYRKEAIHWDRDESILWGFDNYKNRKRPKEHKKVTVCHNTGDRNYPVTITVSENALQAHLNHGDQIGNCRANSSNRWPDYFIKTRENVYNRYEDTWEMMSYSESLLRYAADKLLGTKSAFQVQRPTLSTQEIQRREALIFELQNNVNSLENQLSVSRQRMDGININFNF